MNELTSNTINLDTEITAQNTEGVIFVDINAIDGANDGTSWNNAYTDLQSALAVAGNGDRVWVAQGTYLPVTGDTPPEGFDDIRDVSFVIPSGVEIYGGFTGDENSVIQRDYETNETILSGNIGEGTAGDNSYHVVNISDTAASTIIDGLTITGGQADGENEFRINRDEGGGFRGATNASATLRNLTIRDNFAAKDGGGIYFGDDNSPTIINTTFINNSASDSGGAIHFDDDGNLNIVSSLFVNNQSQTAGGIYIRRAVDSFNVINSTFYDNQGNLSDAIYDDSGRGNDTNILNNVFWNSAAIDRPQVFLESIFISGDLPEATNLSNNIIKGEIPSFERDIQRERDVTLEGNITEDPLFVDPAANNFRLQLGSPGIDAGNNEAVSNPDTSTDVANNPRIYNETIDIGAYEYGLYINIDDVALNEGNEGTTNAEFTATLLDTLGQPTTEEVTVNYTIADDVASGENNDFTADSGTLVFAPEETTEAINVTINGDTDQEESETFFVNLSDASGAAVIQDGEGLGIIQNDDLLGETSTVYRFFNPNVGVHFYTASEAERDVVLENEEQYLFEGASYISAPETDDSLTGISPVYRFFNTNTGVHLYTIDEAERTFIEENLDNYNFEGVSYYGYEEQQEDTIPLYRLYNPVIDAHFYTPSEAEKDAVIENLPDYELDGDGIGFYVQPLDI